MKYPGKAARAAWRLIFWTLVLLLALFAAGAIAVFLSKLIMAISPALLSVAAGLTGLWLLFCLATLFLFRDPNPITPSILNAVVSPAHGRVDVLDTSSEPEFMGGACQRISISISLLDVHVQKAPLSGKIAYSKRNPAPPHASHSPSTASNENLLLGFQAADYPQQKIAVRLSTGFLGRRIIPFVAPGDLLQRSDRISLIQYGSRCDLYLPRHVRIIVKLGEKVKGGETILASFD